MEQTRKMPRLPAGYELVAENIARFMEQPNTVVSQQIIPMTEHHKDALALGRAGYGDYYLVTALTSALNEINRAMHATTDPKGRHLLLQLVELSLQGFGLITN